MFFLVAPHMGQHPSRGSPPKARATRPKRKAARQDKQTDLHSQIHSFAGNLDNFLFRTVAVRLRESAPLSCFLNKAVQSLQRKQRRGFLFVPKGFSLNPRDKNAYRS